MVSHLEYLLLLKVDYLTPKLLKVFSLPFERVWLAKYR